MLFQTLDRLEITHDIDIDLSEKHMMKQGVKDFLNKNNWVGSGNENYKWCNFIFFLI